MKRLPSFLILLLVFAIAFALPIRAQSNQTRFFVAYEYGNLTVDNTAGGVALPAAKVTNPDNPVETAQLITFSVACASGTDCPARFTVDGTTPTTSVGVRVTAGMIISIFQHDNIANFKAIREGSTSAVFNVQYFR